MRLFPQQIPCACALNFRGKKEDDYEDLRFERARAPHEWKDLAHVRQMPIHHLHSEIDIELRAGRGDSAA